MNDEIDTFFFFFKIYGRDQFFQEKQVMKIKNAVLIIVLFHDC